MSVNERLGQNAILFKEGIKINEYHSGQSPKIEILLNLISTTCFLYPSDSFDSDFSHFLSDPFPYLAQIY